jgi:hypothetical protein
MAALAARARSLGNPAIEGPEIVFWMRNRHKHPPKSVTDPEWPDHDELADAWVLSLWYLELVILRVLGYDGQYTSRLRSTGLVSDTERVPWAT